ncbi:hypothetical protein PsorP6_017413 [Peronosclerospora sorghi]|uniref:Uncharacterized protein n=1 Tax=Peronosclerospora sorghi TaxID=230839 RepID=A0ACC0WLK1_9STRA|nr:hypothetical protein PsorP6_017413 [Peronosclerospora sorghi]
MVYLFLMVFAPGIYFDPVKVSMLIPAELPNKRLRTPLLLWNDINLQCVTKTDAVAVFLNDSHTPADRLTLAAYSTNKKDQIEFIYDLDERRTAQLVKAVNDAHDRFNTTSTDHHHEVFFQAQLQLKARNQSRKFAADLHLSERATEHFFRPPQKDFLRSPITGFKDEDGVVTEDPVLVARVTASFGGRFSSLLRQNFVTNMKNPFADDCTGLLSDIQDADCFIELVQLYSKAAGLRLNTSKTTIMPFTHKISRLKIQNIRSSSSFKILGVKDTVNAHRGGLGLTPVKEFIQSMHLKSLGDAIAATVRRCAAPRWMTPAIPLFSKALELKARVLTSCTHWPKENGPSLLTSGSLHYTYGRISI